MRGRVQKEAKQRAWRAEHNAYDINGCRAGAPEVNDVVIIVLKQEILAKLRGIRRHDKQELAAYCVVMSVTAMLYNYGFTKVS